MSISLVLYRGDKCQRFACFLKGRPTRASFRPGPRIETIRRAFLAFLMNASLRATVHVLGRRPRRRPPLGMTRSQMEIMLEQRSSPSLDVP